MTMEARIQVKVRVSVEPLWNALSKDVCSVVPKVLPDRVSAVELIEGDGGLGTILLFKFHARETKDLFDATSGGHQLEKIVDFDESVHQIGLAVLEGGYLDVGFSSYKTVFQLTSNGETETLVDVKVLYSVENQEPKEMNLKATQTYLKSLEDYILNEERLEKDKIQNRLRQPAMKKEMETQVEIDIGIETLWKALSKDLSSVIQKTMPEFISSVEIIEGDGGPGSVFLIKFDYGATSLGYQKEKLVDLDETQHQLGLEVVEGGHLLAGFSYYKTVFQIIMNQESKSTLVNIKAVYETEGENAAGAPQKTLKASEVFIQRLGKFLLNELYDIMWDHLGDSVTLVVVRASDDDRLEFTMNVVDASQGG